tara:strand:- start:6955 stop:7170 length:216 start_codon:yes stop_codon:yes gene_type:complete
MTDIINRKLADAKAKIEQLHKDMNKTPPKEKVTKNMCPPIPEMPDNTGVNEEPVPGVIVGGPKRDNKWKQV